MIAGIRLSQQFVHAHAFDDYRDAQFLGPEGDSDEAITAYLRERIETLYHPVGTCKMGSDAMAVVDSQLRVRGVAGLRVVDASIMPTITKAPTNITTIAIAERASELI
jgi:choline dehydrogenase